MATATKAKEVKEVKEEVKVDPCIAYLECVVKPLVKVDGEVAIDRKDDDMGILLTLNVSREDSGRIIGKAGETAKALRRILHVFGSMTDQKVNLKIGDPQKEGK